MFAVFGMLFFNLLWSVEVHETDLTEVAGEGGTNWAPQKFLSSQKFRHLMG